MCLFLSIQLEKEREKVKKISSSSYIKPPPDFSINSKFLLDPALAAYLLTVELQNPIDILIIRSPVQLDFIETGMIVEIQIRRSILVADIEYP